MTTSAMACRDFHADRYDLDGAHSWMAQICGPHRLQVEHPRHMHFRHDGRMLESAALGIIEYGTDVTIGVEGLQNLNSYSLSLPLCGEQELIKGGERLYSDVDIGIIVAPHESQELAMTGECRKLQVAIPRQAMRQTLESMICRSADIPLRFDPRMDMLDAHTGAWWRMARAYLQEMQSSVGLFAMPQLSADMERLLIKSLILAQPNNYSEELQRRYQVAPPHYLLRAQAFIHDNAREDLRLEDVEAAAGVSRFKLFESFKQHFGTSPMAYLKRYRLNAIRQEILADRSARNISAIAMGWGVTHLGRFSAEYRKLFNETPSMTLQRNLARSQRGI